MDSLTVEQANKIHLLIWNRILDIINEDVVVKYDYREYNVLLIRKKLIGHKKWIFDDPLCEFHKQQKSCPLSMVRGNKTEFCQCGCWHVGKYYDNMTKVQIQAYINYINTKIKEVNKNE